MDEAKAKRDYKAEYKKFQSSTKAKKYRAELNKYNRKKGTYGNGDGKDASHKGGKIVGFEAQSKNRGRKEKSRLKKESTFSVKIDTFQNALKNLDKLSDILKKGGEKKKSMMVSKLVKQLQQAFFRKEMMESIMKEGKLETLALNLLRDMNKNLGIQNYDGKKGTTHFKKVLRFLQKKMPRTPMRKLGDIAMSYDKYRQKQPKATIPDIDSVKDMEKTLKKLGMKEGVNEAKYKGYDYKRQNRKDGLSLIVPALRKTFSDMKDLKKYIDKHGTMESVNESPWHDVHGTDKTTTPQQAAKNVQKMKDKKKIEYLLYIKKYKPKLYKKLKRNPKVSSIIANFVESINEEKYVVYVDKDGKGMRGRKIVKSGLTYNSAKRLSNKLAKTDDYQEVGYDDHKSWNQMNIKKLAEKKGDFLDSLFPKSKVDKAIKIAKKMGGNMTGAVKAIEKFFPGMSKHTKVQDALRKYNESINEKKKKDDEKWKGLGYDSFESVNEGAAEADELKLFIDNDGQLYNQRYMPIIKNLSKKMKKGKFDKRLAVKGFMYLVDAGVKKYIRDYGGTRGTFSKNDKIAVAKEFADEFEIIYKNKEYDFMESKLNELDWNQDLSKMSSEIGRLFKMANIKVLKHIPYKRGYRTGDAALYGAFIHVKDKDGKKTVLPIEIDKKGIIRYAGGPNNWHPLEKIGALNMSHARPDDFLKIKTYARSIDYLKQFAKLPGWGQDVIFKKEGINEQEVSIKDAFKDLVKQHGSSKALEILTSVLTGGIGFEDPKMKKKFQKKLLRKMTTESANQVVYHFKGFTNKDMDELDAMLYRAGVRGTPDFNKRTYTVNLKGSNTFTLDKIMKGKGGKKIKESVNESGLAFAVILRNLAKHAHKKRMYDKLKKKKRESVHENTEKAVRDMISKGYVRKNQNDKHRVMGIGKWLDDRSHEVSATYNDVWIRRIKMGRGGQVQDWWGDTMTIISNMLRESVNERMDKRQAAVTLKQLGGNKFIAMTGAKNFGFGSNGLSFKIGRNAKAVNYVVIDLNGKDLYDIKFQKGTRVLKQVNDVYADQLQKIFTKHTGMYTSL